MVHSVLLMLLVVHSVDAARGGPLGRGGDARGRWQVFVMLGALGGLVGTFMLKVSLPSLSYF